MSNLSVANTLLALRLPEVDLLFGDLRNRYDVSTARSFGCHIAIRPNHPSSGEWTEESLGLLAAVCAFSSPFEIALARVGYSLGAVYLALEPTEPIVRLESRISQLFSAVQSVTRQVMPRVPIAGGLSPRQTVMLGMALENRIKQRGVLITVCSELSLMTVDDGQWMTAEKFALGEASLRARSRVDNTL